MSCATLGSLLLSRVYCRLLMSTSGQTLAAVQLLSTAYVHRERCKQQEWGNSLFQAESIIRLLHDMHSRPAASSAHTSNVWWRRWQHAGHAVDMSHTVWLQVPVCHMCFGNSSCSGRSAAVA